MIQKMTTFTAKESPYFVALICFSIFSTLTISSCKSRVSNQSKSEVKGFEIESDMPLPVMYHIGEKSILLKNHGRSTFTDDEWTNITKAHAHYRKGLYVGQHPAYSERYASKYMSQENKGVPWLMTVKVKPECLAPNRIAPYLTDLHKDRQFINWYKEIAKEKHESFRDSFLKPNFANDHLAIFTSKCIKNRSTKNVYSPSNDKKELEDLWKPFDTEKVESACANTFNAYINQPDLNDTKSTISIVRDTYWPNRGFWYIRDQSCIEQMDSDAESTIKIFADSSDLWDEQPFASGVNTISGVDPGEERLVLLSIFLNAASDIPLIKFPQYYPAIMNRASETGPGRTILAAKAAGSEVNIFPRNVFFASAEAFMRCS
ncbi:MAG: hypothetical protein NT027_08610 [Proteobacteria bacterium]|nr:hypothetical protein [Pseudomonadota bacterium]